MRKVKRIPPKSHETKFSKSELELLDLIAEIIIEIIINEDRGETNYGPIPHKERKGLKK